MGLLRSFHRMRILREGRIPDDTWSGLLEDHPILDGLSHEELALLRNLVTLFLHGKVFEGAEGLELTGFMQSVIAVQACLPILNLGLGWYGSWNTVVVVPDVFVQENREIDRAGVVHEWDEDNSGESWDQGPVVLSWKDVEASGWGDGYNVVIHEAAHKLDMLDGEVNGRPALHRGMSETEWYEVFSRAYVDLRIRTKSRKKRLKIDSYAVECDAEFFAVTSEYFFERPGILLREYPDVYRMLAAFYRQDPVKRLDSTQRIKDDR